MNYIKNYFKNWKLFEKIWLITVCLVMISVWYVNEDNWFILAISISGALNLVLGAKGKIEGLYFAIINSALYAYQTFGIKLYGEVMYNILFSIPVSAIAIYLWTKNKSESGEVNFRNMSKKLMIFSFTIVVVGTIAYSHVLRIIGGNLPLMDSLTTVVAIVASILYICRFSEQWLMWVIVNALSIVMWVMVYINGDKSALLIIIMKITNLVNASYGYYNWKKIAKEHATK